MARRKTATSTVTPQMALSAEEYEAVGTFLSKTWGVRMRHGSFVGSPCHCSVCDANRRLDTCPPEDPVGRPTP